MSFAGVRHWMIQFNKENPDCTLSVEQKKVKKTKLPIISSSLYLLYREKKDSGKGREIAATAVLANGWRKLLTTARTALVMATLAKRKRTKASIMVFSSISKGSEHFQ
jgi:hypothetical protein